MKTANVPHPFDSHPPLAERMRNVGHEVNEEDYGAVVTAQAADGWVADIPVAQALETDMWNDYERHFASAHEVSLAYRYLPATDAEREIVLRHFPDVTYDLKGDDRFGIGYEGLRLPESGELLSWDDSGARSSSRRSAVTGTATRR
jgi:hypothetical protein